MIQRHRGSHRCRSTAGFSIVELAISLVILNVLVVVAMTIAMESSRAYAFMSAETRARQEVNRAYARLGCELRRSGWNSDGVVEYPAVAGGDADVLAFRTLEDSDGNGTLLDDDTGAPEWGAAVHSVKLDATTGRLAIYDASDAIVVVLGSQVTSVRFATFKEDASLRLNEVRVEIRATVDDGVGNPIVVDEARSIFMRN